jgi:hypothetical protein
LSWFHVQLSFNLTSIHLHKHHRGTLSHYKPCITRFQVLFIKKVSFRVQLFCNSLGYSCRSLIGEHADMKFEWIGALYTKLCLIESLMQIFLSFDLDDMWCFSAKW